MIFTEVRFFVVIKEVGGASEEGSVFSAYLCVSQILHSFSFQPQARGHIVLPDYSVRVIYLLISEYSFKKQPYNFFHSFV